MYAYMMILLAQPCPWLACPRMTPCQENQRQATIDRTSTAAVRSAKPLNVERFTFVSAPKRRTPFSSGRWVYRVWVADGGGGGWTGDPSVNVVCSFADAIVNHFVVLVMSGGAIKVRHIQQTARQEVLFISS